MKPSSRATGEILADLSCSGRLMHATDPTDLGLLERIAARDTAALAELYDRHGRLLFGLLLRILRNRAEAEESLQQAFVRVWTRASAYDARAGGPLPWIVRIARDVALERLRAWRRDATIDTPAPGERIAESVPASDIHIRQTVALDAEPHEALTDALSGLPLEQRQLIEAAFFEGFPHSELAARFGLPLETVKARIRAGMIAISQRQEHAV